MLEAFIDPNTGDAIVVKPAGSVWGREETNCVMLIEDDPLEAEMLAAGETMRVYPYAVHEENRRMSVRTEMLAKSAVRVNLTPAQQASMRRRDERPGVLRAVSPPVARLVRKPTPPAKEGVRVIEPRLPTLDTPAPDTRGPR